MTRRHVFVFIIAAFLAGVSAGVIVSKWGLLEFDPKVQLSSVFTWLITIVVALIVPYGVRDVMDRQRRDSDLLSAAVDPLEKRLQDYFDGWLRNQEEPLTMQQCRLLLLHHRRLMLEFDAVDDAIDALERTGRRVGEIRSALHRAQAEATELKRQTTGGGFPVEAFNASADVVIAASSAFREVQQTVRRIRIMCRAL